VSVPLAGTVITAERDGPRPISDFGFRISDSKIETRPEHADLGHSAIRNPQSAIVSLAADIDVLHDHLMGPGRGFEKTTSALRGLGPGDRIRVPLLPDNILRLPKIVERIERETGRRAPNPEMLALSVIPLDTLPERVDNFIAGARMVLDKIAVDLDPAEASLRECFRAANSGEFRDSERLRALGVVANAPLVGPRTFHLDVTNACNTDCAPCWFHSPLAGGRTDLGEGWKKRMLDWDVFAALIDDLAAMKAGEDVVLSGKGEPTVHPRIRDMVRYIKDRGLFATLFTNGIRLDRDLAVTLVEAGCDMLYVSLMASNREVYRRTHTGAPDDEFDRVLANLRTLLEVKGRDVSDKPEIVLVHVINNRNADDIVPFAKLGAELKVEHLRYQLTAIEPYNGELALSDDELRRVKAGIEEAKRIAADAGVKIVANIDAQLDGEANDWSGARYLDNGCLVGWAFSRVWAGGEVSFCCAPKVVRNVNETRFADIWNGEDYDRARVAGKYLSANRDFAFKNGKPLFDPICTRCPNYEGVERLRSVIRGLGLDAWL
jgi:MoaA/NifB/PqqE/SkfB family radical SAM enzyme